MTAKQTLDEMEQPAKNWQIASLEMQLKEMKVLLQTLVAKSDGQVSAQQFESAQLAIRTTFERQLKEEIEKVHLEYGPMKKTITWLSRLSIGAGVGIIGQLITIVVVANRGG